MAEIFLKNWRDTMKQMLTITTTTINVPITIEYSEICENFLESGEGGFHSILLSSFSICGRQYSLCFWSNGLPITSRFGQSSLICAISVAK